MLWLLMAVSYADVEGKIDEAEQQLDEMIEIMREAVEAEQAAAAAVDVEPPPPEPEPAPLPDEEPPEASRALDDSAAPVCDTDCPEEQPCSAC